MDITKIQQYLKEHDLDAWLMADFHGRNDVAVAMLGLGGMLTRRSFYFIPSAGEPTALVNPIEAARFRHLPGKLVAYRGYKGLETELIALLAGRKKVAMEYSPSGRLPYIGLVDAGTIELVRNLGVNIVSSADLVAHFYARLSPEQVAGHRIAARNVLEIKDAAFAFIAERLRRKESVTEHEVCSFMRDKLRECDMITDSGPVCAVDAHAGVPHYEPSEQGSAAIVAGSLVLIDLWGRLTIDSGVYGDITWVAYAGPRAEIPSRYRDIFAVVAAARDEAVAFLRKHIEVRPVCGYEVDDACRAIIEKAGYGQSFTHRTGHSIAGSVHGPGPNIDNLETEDRRKLQRGHLFSIEPGIYLDDCGFRSEIDCLITHEGAEVTTLPLQTEIIPLL